MIVRRISDLPRAKKIFLTETTPVAVFDEQRRELCYMTVGEIVREFSANLQSPIDENGVLSRGLEAV